MGEFFKPWRRKISLLTLMMACISMAGWARSQTTWEEIQLPCGDAKYIRIVSSRGFVDSSFYFNIPSNTPNPNWASVQLHPLCDRSIYREMGDDERLNWRFQLLSFDVGNAYSILPACDGFNETFIAVPYFGCIVPLTLFSAYLLLSMPRKSTQIKTAQTIRNKGASS